MRTQPDFFAAVLEESQKRWNMLQDDPGLRGPWDRLFQQVQRPEHVISELLQNADDAQATWVKLSLTEEAFIFEHNGIDFDAKSFRAICSFGVSNKPFLKTIGQWGIGFKSVFSLGERVEILTPSLAFAFEKSRYIVPEWLEDAEAVDHTVIRILWRDPNQKEIAQTQIERWREDALPLVFFRHIQTFTLEGDCFSHNVQDGPTPSSRWVTLITPEGEETLLMAFQTFQFGSLPEEVRQNIQAQLPLKSDIPSETSLTVSLIAGRSEVDKIYVVLPTSLYVESLPCSLNAPFIQDPGRGLIHQPLYSAANRWFLEALGKLAAQTLMDWLDNRDVSLEERASAYECLLPAFPQVGSSASDRDYVQPFLDGFKTIWNQFSQRHFLTTGGDLTDASSCFDLPAEFFQVWDEPDLREIFLRDESQQLIAPQVAEECRNHLVKWDVHWERKDIRSALHCMRQPPKPMNWSRLATLWELAYRTNDYYWSSDEYSSKNLPLFPAQGQDWLYPSAQVLPLSGNALKNFTAEEYELILRWVNLIEPDWLAYLEELEERHPAKRLYWWLDNYKYRSVSSQDLFQKAVSAFFDQDSWEEEDAIRWAWIAARLNLSLAECNFRYLCQDGGWRNPKQEYIFAELTPELESVLPPEMHRKNVLHDRYHQDLPKEYKKPWRDWLANFPKNSLRGFVSVELRRSEKWQTEKEFEEVVSTRGGHKPERY
uniref:sacsin N-terminal ATP-binding-like domain-containing protein n=1 Tax=Anaerolinea sp. TaxID=1872519 RepID=UPI002ACEDB92